MKDTGPIMHKLKYDRDFFVSASCFMFEINKDSIYKSKKYPNAEIRFSIFKILRDRGYTLASIGGAFNRDHCTVMYGVSQVEYALSLHCNKRLEEIYKRLSSLNQESNCYTIHTDSKLIQNWLSVSNVPEQYVTTLMDNIDMLNEAYLPDK